jgi:hypothetical protein
MSSMWMTMEKVEKAEMNVEMKIERWGGKEDVRSAQRGYMLGITRLSDAVWVKRPKSKRRRGG